MSNIEDATLQNPIETPLENSHFNPVNPNLSLPATNKLNTKALLSLILAIAGVIVPFLGFVAIVLGIYAKQEIVKGKTRNNIIATAGIVLGIIFTVVYVLIAYSKM